jgi:4-hydroxy-tetrahydrodipicolinate reductase
MGRQVAAAVAAETDMAPIAYVDKLATSAAIDGLPVYTDASVCFAKSPADVVIDFTNAAWTPELCTAALANGVRPVIGTTGLSAEFMEWLADETRARKTGAFVASNFAIGAVLMMHFAKQAARFFDNAEIIELHHDQKVDAPSGTAKTTAELMRAARKGPFVHPSTEKETIPGTRGGELGGIAIHSVRLPGLVAHQEVIFGGLGQTLTIRHDSTGRDSFMPGVVAAARAVMGLDHLVVGLDALLGLT